MNAVEEALRRRPQGMTAKEIARAVYRATDDRTMNLVHVALHRLSVRGMIEKTPMKYRLK